MKRGFYYCTIVLLLFFLNSCKEYFSPDIEESEETISVEGILSDIPAQQQIKIYKSRSFSERPYFEPVKDAEVLVYDQYNNFYRFLDTKSTGIYFSESQDFAVKSGIFYTLRVTTANGEVYESTPQRIGGSSDINLVSGLEGEKLMEIANNEGQRSTLKQTGYWLTNNSKGYGNDSYFYYNWKVWLQYKYAVNIVGTPGIPDEVKKLVPLEQTYYNEISVVNANSFANQEVISNKVFFIPQSYIDSYVPDAYEGLYVIETRIDTFRLTAEDDGIEYIEPVTFVFRRNLGQTTFDTTVTREISGETYTNYFLWDDYSAITVEALGLQYCGLQIKLTQYSISYEAYQYYKMLQDQQLAENRIYDPVNTQPSTNIFCTSNNNKTVFGYFTIGSASSKSFYIYQNVNGMNSLETTNFPEIPTRETDVSGRPDLWVEAF